MYQPFTLRSGRPRFEITSPGERLWFTLRDWWFDSLAGQVGPRGLVGFDWLDGDGRPGQALTNIAVSDACTRLARRASKKLSEYMVNGGETAAFRQAVASDIKQYCVMPMSMSFADRILVLIGDLAFECAKTARQEISRTARLSIDRETRMRLGHVGCYVCGLELAGKYPLDHIWPRSLGGVSDEDNLLPICEPCNTRKKDRVGWDVFGVVVDHAYMGQSTEGGFLADMALQRRAATSLAQRDGTTLKEAFIRLGPIGIREKTDPDLDDPWFFNHTVHDLSVLPQLWD